MTGKTHAAAGAVAALALQASAPEAAIAVFGALLPDIDHESSILGRYVKPIAEILPHRGPTHSLLMLVLCFAINPWLGLGIATHLLLDAMTGGGVPLLWPYGRKMRLPLAKYNSTGSTFEKAFYAILIIGIVAYCAMYAVLAWQDTLVEISNTAYTVFDGITAAISQ